MMMPYNIALLMTILLFFVCNRFCVEKGEIRASLGKKLYSPTFFKSLLIGFPLFILPALQYDVGADYWQFFSMFSQPHERWEPLYVLTTHLLNAIFGHPQSLFVAFSAFFVFSVVYLYSRYTSNVGLAVFIFYCLNLYWTVFNEVRYGFAIVIVMYSLQYIFERKLWQYCVCMLLAFGFHYSAIVFWPMYFLYGLNISFKLGSLITAFFVVVRFVLGPYIYSWIGNTYYGFYIGSKFDAQRFGSIWFLVVFGIIIAAGRFFGSNERKYVFLLNSQYIIILMLLYKEFIPLITRIDRYFLLLTPIMLVMMLDNIRRKKLRLTIGIGMCICFFAMVCVLFCTDYQRGGWALIRPYQTVFDVGMF